MVTDGLCGRCGAAAATLMVFAAGASADLSERAAKALELEACDVQAVHAQPGPYATWRRVAIAIDGTPVTVVLWPHDVRAEGFRIIESDGIVHREVSAGLSAAFRGEVEGWPGSRVAGSVGGDGRVRLYIESPVHGGPWSVQPVGDVIAGAGPELAAVYEVSAIRSEWLCAVEGSAGADDGGDAGVLVGRGDPCAERIVTLEITADAAFTAQNGAAAIDRIEFIVNAASMPYETQLSTRIMLSGVRLLTNDPWRATTDSGALLDAFTSYLGGAPLVGEQRDLAHLASALDFDGAYMGRAWIDSICRTSTHNSGVNQMTFSDAFCAHILAHEMGHNFNAAHDSGACDSGYIMGASAAPSRPATEFSSCSVQDITRVLGRSCVEDALDENRDGVPDHCEPAVCACETTGDAPASVDVFDLLAYLDAWFAGSAAADRDGAPGIDVFDLLAYLNCWFSASGGGPCA